MISQTLIIVVGLALAGWGHLLTHDLFGAGAAWTRVDDMFPPVLRSEPSFAGWVLMIMGALLVLIPVLS